MPARVKVFNYRPKVGKPYYKAKKDSSKKYHYTSGNAVSRQKAKLMAMREKLKLRGGISSAHFGGKLKKKRTVKRRAGAMYGGVRHRKKRRAGELVCDRGGVGVRVGSKLRKARRKRRAGELVADRYGVGVKVGSKLKKKKKLSEYNMFVRKFIKGHRGANIADAAAAWRKKKRM
jgi:hypothetical protein